MDKFIINGGKRISGSVEVSGAKNASLALMPVTLLAPGKSPPINTHRLNRTEERRAGKESRARWSPYH